MSLMWFNGLFSDSVLSEDAYLAGLGIFFYLSHEC